jgi:sugar O-acyltransferase (sialic acid O-acetyltransferase NeuD family)
MSANPENSATGDEQLQVAIIGAAGGGVEVLVYIREMAKRGADVRPYGFIDDNPNLAGQSFFELPVLGSTDWAIDNLPKNVAIVSSIGNTSKKDSVMKRFADAGFQFFTVVHPSAIVGPECVIGIGTVIGPGVVITANVKIGEHCFINVGTTISHDVIIGPCTTLNQGVRIAGSVRLGRGVYLGASATILHSMEVGDFAVIGASAMVNRNIPPRVTAVGIPAKVLQPRTGGSSKTFRPRPKQSGTFSGQSRGPYRSGGGYREGGGGYRDHESGGGNYNREGGGNYRDSGSGGGYRDRESGGGNYRENRDDGNYRPPYRDR